MRYPIISLLCATLFFSDLSAKDPKGQLPRRGWYGSLAGGISWSRTGQNQLINTPSGSSLIANQFTINKQTNSINKQTNSNGFVSGGFGWWQKFGSRFTGSLGIHGYAISYGTNSGILDDDMGFTDDEQYYSYSTRSYALMAQTKLGWDILERWQPFVMAGIGPSWNCLSNYSQTPASSTGMLISSEPLFSSSHTQTDLAYLLGAGVMYKVNPQIGLSLSYRFFDAGHGRLKPTGDPSTQPLSDFDSGRLQSHLLAFAINIFFSP